MLSALPERRHTETLLDHRSKLQYIKRTIYTPRKTRQYNSKHNLRTRRILVSSCTTHFLTSDCIKFRNDINTAMFLNQHILFVRFLCGSPPRHFLFVCVIVCNNDHINHTHPVLYKLISSSFTPQSDPKLPFLFLPLTSDLKLKEFRGEKEIL